MQWKKSFQGGNPGGFWAANSLALGLTSRQGKGSPGSTPTDIADWSSVGHLTQAKPIKSFSKIFGTVAKGLSCRQRRYKIERAGIAAGCHVSSHVIVWEDKGKIREEMWAETECVPIIFQWRDFDYSEAPSYPCLGTSLSFNLYLLSLCHLQPLSSDRHNLLPMIASLVSW